MAAKVEYNRSENAQREFRVLDRRHEMGRTRVKIECPFLLDAILGLRLVD